MPSAVGIIEGDTTTPITIEEDGTTTGDDLIMITTIIRPAIHLDRTTIVPIMVDTPGGRFSLIGNGMGKDGSSPYK